MNDERLHDSTLRDQAQRLGQGAAERLDVEGVVQRVLGRLRQAPIERRPPFPWWVRLGWMRVAAAIVVVMGAGLVLRGTVRDRESRARLVVEELQGLSTAQLQEVLGTLDQTLRTPVPENGSDDLNDLTTEQLEALLKSLEG